MDALGVLVVWYLLLPLITSLKSPEHGLGINMDFFLNYP